MSEQNTQPSKLVYHRLFTQFEGDTPEEIVQQLYRDSKEGTGQTFSEWWEYQRKLCKKIDGADTPAQDTSDAAVKLMAVLVQYGYLEEGSLSLER